MVFVETVKYVLYGKECRMSIRSEYKKCSNCGSVYSFNPDVGNLSCPVCGSMSGKTVLKKDVKMRDIIKTKIKEKL